MKSGEDTCCRWDPTARAVDADLRHLGCIPNTTGAITLDGADVGRDESIGEREARSVTGHAISVGVPILLDVELLHSAATTFRGRAAETAALGPRVGRDGRARSTRPSAFSDQRIFSGGEKKCHEILQLELLQAQIAILDETDSGLDVGNMRVVSEGWYAESQRHHR